MHVGLHTTQRPVCRIDNGNSVSQHLTVCVRCIRAIWQLYFMTLVSKILSTRISLNTSSINLSVPYTF